MPDVDLAKQPVPGQGVPNGKAESQMTVISESDSLSGRLVMKGDGHLLGAFEGEVECDGEILVGKDARVEARIVTRNITISGSVRGNLTASGRLKITATGRLEGDARVGSLIVQEGGVHLGAIQVHPEGVPAQDFQPPPPGPAEAPVAEAHEAQTRPITTSVDRVKKMWGEFF
ncbi:MAG TPA: polymer-forming cytoskeletal protein [Candidatus Nitrosotalea sp.]|nr:polymer-forming cytoskeletal protein [Candidatus Nitrosotalea sp.]